MHFLTEYTKVLPDLLGHLVKIYLRSVDKHMFLYFKSQLYMYCNFLYLSLITNLLEWSSWNAALNLLDKFLKGLHINDDIAIFPEVIH